MYLKYSRSLLFWYSDYMLAASTFLAYSTAPILQRFLFAICKRHMWTPPYSHKENIWIEPTNVVVDALGLLPAYAQSRAVRQHTTVRMDVFMPKVRRKENFFKKIAQPKHLTLLYTSNHLILSNSPIASSQLCPWQLKHFDHANENSTLI